jgi:hypothetical protein
VRGAAAWLAVIALVLPSAAPAQQPMQQRPASPSTGAPAPAAPTGFKGSFEGKAVLTNEDAGLVCRYETTDDTPPVRLEIGAGASMAGSIAIDFAAPPGGSCPPLRKRYVIRELVVEGRSLSFTDSGGNEWNLSLRESGSQLQGLLAWRQGGVDEPLAEGFSGASGRRPMSRLSGEVSLHRVVPGAAGASAATSPPAGAGKQAGNVLAIIGANVVGLGLLYGANELGKGSSESGVVTCSPRTCITGAPNEPCFCESNVLSGASCGTTPAGMPIGGPCSLPSEPCQAGLSCNSGICEDRSGRCPY